MGLEAFQNLEHYWLRLALDYGMITPPRVINMTPAATA